MNFHLPQAVIYILNTLESFGYEAFCVGGCVRDLIRGEAPSDYDIATNAPVEEIMRIFPDTVPTGIRHGTVTVLVNHCPYEVTRYRVDGEYLDHRRPNTVAFCNSLSDDLSRRDFTVNAMGYSPRHGLCDPFGGRKDIKARILRAVGEPEKRFFEDALRILRAVRFSSVLGYEIEPKTYAAMLKTAGFLNKISAERISIELLKTLGGTKPSALLPIIENGGFSAHGINSSGRLQLLDKLPNDRLLRMAALLYLTKSKPAPCLKSLRFKRADAIKADAFWQILSEEEPALPKLKPFAAVVGYDGLLLAAESYGILHSCDAESLKRKIADAKAGGDAFCLKMLKINGNTLIKLGYSGAEIGKIQKILLQKVLENPNLNAEDRLIKIAAELKKD